MTTEDAPGGSLSILLDSHWLVDGPPSGRNVLISLVSAWAESFPDDSLILAVPNKRAAADRFPELARFDVLEVPKPRGMVHGLWVALRLGSYTADYDVVITQNFTPLLLRPERRAVLATFIHDVLFLEHPEWFTWKERLYLRGVTLGARHADVLLTSSIAERRRITRTWRAQASKVRAVGLAVPLSLQRAAPASPSDILSSGGRPFLLAVGRLNVRKNLARLIGAYAASSTLRAQFDLVIVGAADGRRSSLDPRTMPPTVRFLGTVSDGELVWLYRHCRLFVFPSLDEGFGLPLIEAKNHGAEVAASDIEVFRELNCADHYFDPVSMTDMQRVLESALRPGAVKLADRANTPLPEWAQVVNRIRAAVRRAGP